MRPSRPKSQSPHSKTSRHTAKLMPNCIHQRGADAFPPVINRPANTITKATKTAGAKKLNKCNSRSRADILGQVVA